MEGIVRREGLFIGLLLTTNKKQRDCLLQSITVRQLRTLVEIIYNALHGYLTLPEKELEYLQKYKTYFRLIVTKRISRRERVNLLIRHFNKISRLLREIKGGISVQWRKN